MYFSCVNGVRLLVLDCYSDPLGWKDRLLKSASSAQNSAKSLSSVFKSVKDISKLLSLILELGQGSNSCVGIYVWGSWRIVLMFAF